MKLNLLFKDRVGIVADISTLLAENDLSIVSMEVQRKENRADIYLEAESGRKTPSREEVFELLGKIPDLVEMRFIETLPQEMRENRFRVVLDNISDGVISIDGEGRITTINRVARQVLNCNDDNVTGKSIKELNLPDYSVLECLNGKKFNNVKKSLVTEKGRFQYFATSRPITDSSERIIGAVEIGKDMQEIRALAQSISQPSEITFSDFIGTSPAIKEAIAFAQKIARTSSIVTIRGESGTGKELFARAIHSASDRDGPFVPVNCAALPEPLLESELFGYAGGAFTGAKKEGKPGLFEIARRGTIFLDEIAEMPLSPQARILRLIQEKSVRRIGGTQELAIDTRIITASNRNLEQMVEEKQFRQDLYYRINVLPIHIPPLRERVEDIPILIEHFLFQLASSLGKKAQRVSQEAMSKLCRHGWPGNVRELKNVIERAAILCDSDTIGAEYVLFSFEIGRSMKEIKQRPSPGLSTEDSLQALLDLYEKQLVTTAVNGAKSIRKAAKALQVSHTTLLNKLKKHGIRMERVWTDRGSGR